MNHGWREISELLSVSRGLNRRPTWSIVLFAFQSDDQDLAERTRAEHSGERQCLVVTSGWSPPPLWAFTLCLCFPPPHLDLLGG